ncbi:MAG: hydrolase [bacterium]
MSKEKPNTECCPKFNPAPWDNKMLEWDNKKFIKDKVFTMFFMPINFGSVVKRMMAKIEKSGGKALDWMGLSDHTSKWNMDLYVAVDREIPDIENISLSGKFFSKVYEGDFKDTGRWCKDFESQVKDKNLKVKKWYMWYTTCPKCAKKYGKNYVVIVGAVE